MTAHLHSLLPFLLLALGYVTLVGAGPWILEPGVSALLWSGATAAAGTIQFCVQPSGMGTARTLNLEALGTAVLPTTLTANVEQSTDGGATWQAYGTSGTGIALVATSTGTAFALTNLVSGPLYRINVTSLTLGNATAASVIGTLS